MHPKRSWARPCSSLAANLRLSAFICGLLLSCPLFALPAIAATAAEQDPYHYLEDAGDPRTQRFYREQAAWTRTVLDAIPGRDEMLARIRTLSRGAAVVTHVEATPGQVFYLKLEPGAGAAVLCMREGVAGPERVLVDPSRYDAGPRLASIDWFRPAHDGRHVAFGVSTGGSADSVLRVVAVEGARVLPLEIDRARFNEELAWHPDGRSFYYARIPEGNPPARRYANVRVYRHVLGRDTDRDEIVFAAGVGGARDVPEFVRPSLHLPLDSPFAYAIARDGARREIAVHVALQRELAAGRPRWRKIVHAEDEVLAIEGWRNDLFLLSKQGAPRHQLLRMKGGATLATARPVVPQGDAVIRAFGLARDGIYLTTMVGGVDRLERVPIGLLGAKAPEFLRTPFDTAISQLVTHPRLAGALLRLQGWIEPPAVMQVEAAGGELRRTPIQPEPRADFSGIDEVRLYAPAHDGTKIPVTMVYRKSTRLDARNPTLVVAYGAYGIPFSPSFDPARLAWLERGGVFAVAHVRGGGEYGEEWHREGRGSAKVNSILDLIAVSEFVVRYGFTSPGRLAIQGTREGGIPVGGALVRRPELFAAVVGRAPVVDVLRFGHPGNGGASIPEFGSPRTQEGLAALQAVSSYHHVKEGAEYPAVLLTAGLEDAAVAPWQPAKMAARLQAASRSGRPVLLRAEAHAGPGRGATRAQREEELADIYSFLLWQMGDPRFAPHGPPSPNEAAPPPAQ